MVGTRGRLRLCLDVRRQRFVMAENLGDPKYTIHVVQNWFEEFRDQTEP